MFGNGCVQHMSIKTSSSILDHIGNTPLIKLSRFNTNLAFDMYVKCEMFNPGLSIKDRIVHSIIRDLEKQNKIKPGATIIEASSGNTGSSLAMIAVILGYQAVITVPSKTSLEKIKTMQAFGAEVIVCASGVPPDSPEHYTNKAKTLSSTRPNAILLGQYDSQVNVQTHYEQTARELWEQMDGEIDCLVAAASSGGTITGIAKFLKEKSDQIKVIMPDPLGSVFYHYFHHGNLQITPEPYRVEGAGKDKVCSIHDFNLIDDVIQFTDDDAFNTTKRLAQTEGILAGGSSGGALFVAEQLNIHPAKQGKRSNVVVILADSGFKYLSYSD